MNVALQILHWLSGLVVLAEVLNKLERTCPLAHGLTLNQRLVSGLKSIAWLLLGLGSGMSLLALSLGTHGGFLSILRLDHPILAETSVLAWFAVLIVRTRIKE